MSRFDRQVYLAGSSHVAEMTVIKTWWSRLDVRGIRAEAPWIESIESVGAANPKDVSAFDRVRWSLEDLTAIDRSEIVWFLRPSAGGSTRGAYYETGYCHGAGKLVIVSGPDARPCIFDALATAEFPDHEDAFRWICRFFRVAPEGTGPIG